MLSLSLLSFCQHLFITIIPLNYNCFMLYIYTSLRKRICKSIVIQNRNFLRGMLATVASTESNASISSADTTFPRKFRISTYDSLNDWASICNSSIMKRLFDKSRSFRFWFFYITSANLSAASEDNLLPPTWHTRSWSFSRMPSASFSPASSSRVLLFILSSFRLFVFEMKS